MEKKWISTLNPISSQIINQVWGWKKRHWQKRKISSAFSQETTGGVYSIKMWSKQRRSKTWDTESTKSTLGIWRLTRMTVKGLCRMKTTGNTSGTLLKFPHEGETERMSNARESLGRRSRPESMWPTAWFLNKVAFEHNYTNLFIPCLWLPAHYTKQSRIVVTKFLIACKV